MQKFLNQVLLGFLLLFGTEASCEVGNDMRGNAAEVGRYDPQINLMCAGRTINRSLGACISVRTAWLLGAQLWARHAVPDIRLYDWRDVAWQRSVDDAVHGADGYCLPNLIN